CRLGRSLDDARAADARGQRDARRAQADVAADQSAAVSRARARPRHSARIRLVRSDLPRRSLAQAGGRVPPPRDRSPARRTAVRTLQHGQAAVQRHGRADALPVPESIVGGRFATRLYTYLMMPSSASERAPARALTIGETSPWAAASTALAVVTGSDTASQSAAVASTATSTPTTPTRLRLNRALIVRTAQCTTGHAYSLLGRTRSPS